MVSFLQRRCRIMENSVTVLVRQTLRQQVGKALHRYSFIASVDSSSLPLCTFCDARDHYLPKCSRFLNLSPHVRFRQAKKLHLCLNCLRKGHRLQQCKSTYCKYYQLKHHSLLHFNQDPSVPFTASSLSSDPLLNSQPSTSSSALASSHSSSHSSKPPPKPTNFLPIDYVLLPTAIIYLRNKAGEFMPCRAILDSASQLNFITSRLANQLNLNYRKSNTLGSGIGESSLISDKAVDILAQSRDASYRASFSAVVTDSITEYQPHFDLNAVSWKIPENISLADPHFNRSDRIDLIIVAGLFFEIMATGQIYLGSALPTLQNTKLGWIVECRVEGCRVRLLLKGVRESTQLRCHRVLLDTEAWLKRFCQVESVPECPSLSEGDLWCEAFFQKTYVRRGDGRYIVRLPFKTYRDPAMVLGRSQQMALNRFLQLERRLSSSPDRWSKYVDEIEEYFALEQIAPAVGSKSSSVKNTSTNMHVTSCVLPHHAVFKKEPQSAKQRIVFDASSRTSNGRSLNDILWTGPTLQNDMSAVILNWRKYRFVFTADIQKMYRCIDVHPEDAQYQRILWRAADGSIHVYALSTLKFGTASAPFTAIRVIQQLAKDERRSFPKAEEVLMH
ncbi:hypothetical protein KR200_009135 [Drosophila serrata]|nr:hypothetical protein KR200_009135 [Drosophila serrata]